MKKLILVLGLLVLLVGCNIQDGGRVPTAVDFRKGYGGLEIESLEGLPPDEMYEGSSFKIGLRLENTGAYDIDRGTIEIAGMDERFVTLGIKKTELEPVPGKSVTNPDGGFYIEEFSGQILRGLGQIKEQKINYYLVGTYDYRSEAQTDVCVNTNLYSDLALTEEGCKPVQNKKLGGQGAPVAISSVEEIIIPEGSGAKIVFKLKVENKAKGKVVGPVYMEEVKMGNIRLTCEQRLLDLNDEDKEDYFVCNAYESQAAAYTTPLYAAIYYTYQTKVKKDFEIKSLQV